MGLFYDHASLLIVLRVMYALGLTTIIIYLVAFERANIVLSGTVIRGNT